MKRVDIIKSSDKSYTFESYTAIQLHKAFSRLNIFSKIVSIDEGELVPFLENLSSSTTLTCSFTHFSPELKPLSFFTKIPHLLIQPNLGGAFSHVLDPLAKICLFDQRSVAFFEKASPSSLLFHPFPPSSFGDIQSERVYDVVLFQDLIDLAVLYNTWNVLFTHSEVILLQQTMKTLEKTPELPPIAALLQNLKTNSIEHPRGGIDNWLMAIEEALPADKTLKMMESLAGFSFHMFGNHIGNNWLTKLKNRDSIFLYDVLPFTLHFKVLNQAKVLIIAPHASYIGSDWMFPALASGCFVLIPPNPFLESLFGKEAPFFYPIDDDEILEEKLHFYLSNKQAREEALFNYVPLIEKYSWSKFAEKLESEFM